MRCACIFFRCRVLPYGVDGAWAACTRAVLWGSRAVTARAFWCSPSRCDASALWLVPRARRSAAKAVHCLRVASSAAANRDHRATTKPRTTRRRRPGRLHPSPYGLFGRTRESNPNGVVLESTRSAASPPRRAAARVGARGSPQARRRHPTPSPRQQPAKSSSRAASSSITQGEGSPIKWTSPS